MADKTLFQGDKRIMINPDNGVISLQLGHISIKGQCRAEFNLFAQRTEAISGERVSDVWQTLIKDVNGTGTKMSVRYSDSLYDLGMLLEIIVYDNQPYIGMRVGLLNHGVEQIFTQKITLLEGTLIDSAEKPLDGWVNGFHSWSFTGFVPHSHRQPQSRLGFLTGPQAYNPTTPRPRKPGQYVSEWVGALIDREEYALIAGFVGVENQFGQVYMNGNPRSRTLTLENTLDGIPMVSGEKQWSEWAVIYNVKLPNHDPLGPYAEAVARLTPPRPTATPPLSGWSSWYQFFDRVTSADMARNQHILRDLRDRLPIEVIQLDDGYQPAWGDWLQHNSQMPEGVPGWANAVRSEGFEPGLWLSPFTVDPGSTIYNEYPEAVLRDKRGRVVHGGRLAKRWLKGLDTTHPATKDFIQKTIETIVEQWGIHYLKLDFLYTGALPGIRHDPTRTRAQALRDGLSLIRELAGDSTVILGCGCPLGPAVGIADIMRVSADIAPYWYPELFGISPGFRNDYTLPSTRNSITESINRHWTNRRWWWIDADNVLVREGQRQTAVEVQTLVSVAGLLDSHIVLSDDLSTTSGQRLGWATTLLPIIPGDVVISDLFSSTTPGRLIKRYHGAAGPHIVVGLINLKDHAAQLSITRQEAGLPAGVPLLVHDFWRGTVKIIYGDTIAPEVTDQHGIALLGIRPLEKHPQFVGSNLHISLGGEVTDWQHTDQQISLTIEIGRRASGSIWLKLPTEPRSIICNGKATAYERVESGPVYRIDLAVDYEAKIDVSLL
nr:alpha-galactosidase [Anaerolineae bacterium]